MSMSRTNIIVASRTDDQAGMALSSFIHALFELDYCAIARLVAKDGKDPVLLLLSPSIEPDFEALIDTEIPFAEDVRQYKFPPLDRIVTVSGKILKEHRNLPSPDLQVAMDALVKDMDLNEYDMDDEGSVKVAIRMHDSPLTSPDDLKNMHNSVTLTSLAFIDCSKLSDIEPYTKIDRFPLLMT